MFSGVPFESGVKVLTPEYCWDSEVSGNPGFDDVREQNIYCFPSGDHSFRYQWTRKCHLEYATLLSFGPYL